MPSCDSPSCVDTFGISMHFSYPDSHCSLSTFFNISATFGRSSTFLSLRSHTTVPTRPATAGTGLPDETEMHQNLRNRMVTMFNAICRKSLHIIQGTFDNDSSPILYVYIYIYTYNCIIYTLAFQRAMDNTLQ